MIIYKSLLIQTGPPLFEVQTTWTFYATKCTMDVVVTACAAVADLPSLPRIGVLFTLPSDMSECKYHGRGPDECYADRKRSNQEGIWKMNVDDCHVPYVVPSENGGRCDVHSMILSSSSFEESSSIGSESSSDSTNANAGKHILMRYNTTADDETSPEEAPEQGLFFHQGGQAGRAGKRPAGTNGAQIMMSRFTMEELNSSIHDDELLRNDEREIQLYVDTAHMGVGGDTGWTPETHLQYRIKAEIGTKWKYQLELEM